MTNDPCWNHFDPLKITCTKSSFEGPPNVPAEFALWPTSTSLTTPQSSGALDVCVPKAWYLLVNLHSYWKWHIYIGFTHSMVIFHSVLYVYQTVPSVRKHHRYGWYSRTDQKIHRTHHQSHDDWWYPWVTGVMTKTSTIIKQHWSVIINEKTILFLKSSKSFLLSIVFFTYFLLITNKHLLCFNMLQYLLTTMCAFLSKWRGERGSYQQNPGMSFTASMDPRFCNASLVQNLCGTRHCNFLHFATLKMVMEIVDSPMNRMVIFHFANCKRWPEAVATLAAQKWTIHYRIYHNKTMRLSHEKNEKQQQHDFAIWFSIY